MWYLHHQCSRRIDQYARPHTSMWNGCFPKDEVLLFKKVSGKDAILQTYEIHTTNIPATGLLSFLHYTYSYYGNTLEGVYNHNSPSNSQQTLIAYPYERNLVICFVGSGYKRWNMKIMHYWSLWGEPTSGQRIPITLGQLCVKYFHIMTLSWYST